MFEAKTISGLLAYLSIWLVSYVRCPLKYRDIHMKKKEQEMTFLALKHTCNKVVSWLKCRLQLVFVPF